MNSVIKYSVPLLAVNTQEDDALTSAAPLRRIPSSLTEKSVDRSKAADISVIIVNHEVAALLLDAVDSVLRQRFTGTDGGDGCLEILVADNASSPEDLACLDRLPSSVIQIRNRQNLGFAQANNLAIQQARGRYLCFLNPDVLLFEGALSWMLGHLYRDHGVGAVGPRTWADPDRRFLLPPGDQPTLGAILKALMAVALPAIGVTVSAAWHRRAFTILQETGPVNVGMLPGACIVTPRAVIDRVGGFDPGYFLYYEDTDWCRRVRRAGYVLHYLPDAEIMHYHHQSAKAAAAEAQAHARASQLRFAGVHYGAAGERLCRLAQALAARGAATAGPRTFADVIDLGRLTAPPELCVGGQPPTGGGLAFQLGYNRLLVPSATAFVPEGRLRLPKAMWERMSPGRYFARAVEPATLRERAVWTWERA